MSTPAEALTQGGCPGGKLPHAHDHVVSKASGALLLVTKPHKRCAGRRRRLNFRLSEACGSSMKELCGVAHTIVLSLVYFSACHTVNFQIAG